MHRRMWQGVMLVSCLAFVCLVAGGCGGRPQGEGAAEVGNAGPARANRTLVRALWVWNARVITDQTKRGEFLAFCREKGIDLIFADVGSIFAEPNMAARKPPVAPNELADFASAVHAAGMKLHALDGDASWSRAENHDAAIGRLERALAFNRGRQTDHEKLDGFQFDIEPHTLGGLTIASNEWVEVLGEYLDLVENLAETVSETAPHFELGSAIPFWWDEENTEASELTWQGTTQPVAHHLIDTLGSLESPYVAIMAYRDKTDGPDGSIAHSEHELAYADQEAPNIRVYVGQETADVPDEPGKITFWQEGEDALDEAVAQIETALGSHETFAGVAIHYYDSYRSLAERVAETVEPEQGLAITSPREGDRVGRFTTVSGVAAPGHAGRRVRVSVLPEGDIWYEQGSGTVSTNGRWSVSCHIGGAATPAGMRFIIRAEMDGEVVEIHVVKQ